MSELSLLRRVIPASVQQKVGRTLLKLDKASPQILFGVGLVGFGATVVLASSATLKVETVIDEFESKRTDMHDLREMRPERYTTQDYNQDLVYIYVNAAYSLVKLYGPALLVGAASVACLTKSHNILNGRNAALTAAYAGIDKAFHEYRQRVEEEVGAQQELDLYRGSMTKSLALPDPNGNEDDLVESTYRAPDPSKFSPYARFFDETNEYWERDPAYNVLFLQAQQRYATEMLRARGHIFLNEVYDSLGIERSREGAVVGWILDGHGDDFVDFGFLSGQTPEARAFVNRQEPSVILDFNVDGLIYDKI
jgi:hypothetical protein